MKYFELRYFQPFRQTEITSDTQRYSGYCITENLVALKMTNNL